ncbi:heme oxygenase-like protein [Hypoxylon sp. FL1284]|nr:heme oxygenase-like protein [Hypoxylon sp. FL1284]
MSSKIENPASTGVGVGAGAGASTNTDTSASANRSIGDAINIATRSLHTKLNKLIVMRLPLALPPQADDASNYVQGLLHIAPIYEAFESIWQDILDADPVDPLRETPDDKSEKSDASRPPTASPRIHLLLFQLRLDKMIRFDALRQDLMALTGWSDAMLNEQLSDVVDESPALAEFVKHIRQAAAERPHVLLAYAWVLYMALFSGGRFIRATLERVDPASPFWAPLSAASEPSGSEASAGQGIAAALLGPWLAGQVGLSGASKDGRNQNQATTGPQELKEHPLAFFRFDTPSDGEDLKQTFKARLAAATTEGGGGNLLSTAERDDAVREARLIFESMLGAVASLDEVCGTDEQLQRRL